MTHLEPDRNDAELAAMLVRARPHPDAQWVSALEGDLKLSGRSESSFVWRRPHLRLGAAVVVGFATVLLCLALAGVGPLAGDGANVRAKDECRTVLVKRVERVPIIVSDGNGGSRVRYRNERVSRYEKRCK